MFHCVTLQAHLNIPTDGDRALHPHKTREQLAKCFSPATKNRYVSGGSFPTPVTT